MATFTITQLAFNVYVFGDAMRAMNEINEAKDGAKWGADYLVNCISDSENFVGQFGVSEIGTTDIDFGYFGPPEEYEMWVPNKVMHPAGLAYVNSTTPSSEILGESAAALAATSVIFADTDKSYSDALLAHAKDLYTRGTTHLGSYMQAGNDTNWATVKEWYPSSAYWDELAWASAWLFVATKDSQYQAAFDNYAKNVTDHNNEYSWDEKLPGAYILMYKNTQQDAYKAQIESFMANFYPGGPVKQTAKGLSMTEVWGSLRYAANTAFIFLSYAQAIGYHTPNGTKAVTYAAQQVNYALGDCGRSWVVGFGKDSPIRPYHKSSYNSFIDYPMRGQDNAAQGQDFLTSLTPNRFILWGALVGGPAWDDSVKDDRTNYEYTDT
ncbi:hypothetical protein FRB99_002605 [Tulasnella sp. 403]|nr:hypothetical protein FRB99_002605 [Tulasnella sp. 403]